VLHQIGRIVFSAKGQTSMLVSDLYGSLKIPAVGRRGAAAVTVDGAALAAARPS
jgi:hypothetical protein